MSNIQFDGGFWTAIGITVVCFILLYASLKDSAFLSGAMKKAKSSLPGSPTSTATPPNANANPAPVAPAPAAPAPPAKKFEWPKLPWAWIALVAGIAAFFVWGLPWMKQQDRLAGITWQTKQTARVAPGAASEKTSAPEATTQQVLPALKPLKACKPSVQHVTLTNAWTGWIDVPEGCATYTSPAIDPLLYHAECRNGDGDCSKVSDGIRLKKSEDMPEREAFVVRIRFGE